MSKSEPVESVKALVVGAKDFSGNKVINVLAKHDEYVIYEIATDDINNKLKVFIDGRTDASEKLIQDRFNTVKQKYIEAKGMLSRSSNFEMMKHRVAHTLSTALNSSEVDGKKEFDELISIITKEHEELVVNRTIYLLPAFITLISLFAYCLYNIDSRIQNGPDWQIIVSLLGASLGGGLSILINAKTLNFEEFKTRTHYFLLGVERMFLACMAGAIAYIALKSGLLSPEISAKGYWPIMLVIVVSGFSESLVPSFLSRSEGMFHNKALQRTNR